ncbi:MAG: hypothetical protein ABIC91_04810 [Nanoarchaeota archaeon]|nr:hypothetical protein [Nanoarchaeota archaeon]MBU1030696.1 hypothetical protein [Nanoarchaeota archaeon]MBU1849356.1 hypothetical protein [Nanoarchaeota archaeon]
MSEENVFLPKQNLYDVLKENPLLITKLENTPNGAIIRGFAFEIESWAMIEIPDREILRTRIKKKYDLEKIDEYFIPIMVDTETYRDIKGKEKPRFGGGSIEELLREINLPEGHVNRINNHFIAYICTKIGDITQAIEHEAIHAYIMQKNPYYKHMMPTYSYTFEKQVNLKDLGWMEAIAWTATNEELDVKKVVDRYTNKFQRVPIKYLTQALIIRAIEPYLKKQSKTEKTENRRTNHTIIYKKLIRDILTEFQKPKNISTIKEQWTASFTKALKLKNEYGVKEFLKKAALEHENKIR